jgi:hypothetical protein
MSVGEGGWDNSRNINKCWWLTRESQNRKQKSQSSIWLPEQLSYLSPSKKDSSVFYNTFRHPFTKWEIKVFGRRILNWSPFSTGSFFIFNSWRIILLERKNLSLIKIIKYHHLVPNLAKLYCCVGSLFKQSVRFGSK